MYVRVLWFFLEIVMSYVSMFSERSLGTWGMKWHGVEVSAGVGMEANAILLRHGRYLFQLRLDIDIEMNDGPPKIFSRLCGGLKCFGVVTSLT
jgi:hypothetical protein